MFSLMGPTRRRGLHKYRKWVYIHEIPTIRKLIGVAGCHPLLLCFAASFASAIEISEKWAKSCRSRVEQPKAIKTRRISKPANNM